MRNAAFGYLTDNGYSIFPIKKNTKIPKISSWLSYQQIPMGVEDVSDFFDKGDNIAIVTGRLSNLTIIDIDVKGGKSVPLETFPKTFTVRTPSGGYHLYYKFSKKIHSNKVNLPQYPNVDIRSEGGYVVAPPSYVIEKEKGYEGKYEVINDGLVLEFPDELFVSHRGVSKTRQGIETLKYFPSIEEGGRNDALSSFANHIYKLFPKKVWPTATEAVFGANTRFPKPLSDKEVETISQSFMKRHGDSKEIELHVDEKGNPYKTLENLVKTLEADEELCSKFRYNSFKNMFETQYNTPNGNWRNLDNPQIIEVILHLQENVPFFSKLSKEVITDAVTYISWNNQVNPIREYIEKLKWDGKSRIDKWLHHTYGVDDSELHKAFGANWLMGMVQRVVHPGSKFDYVLVIEGIQDQKKGLAFTTLVTFEGIGNLHVELTESPDNKDFFMSLNGNLIVEFSEGEVVRKASLMRLKSIITNSLDKYRIPYGKSIQEYPRQCVFAMSTNEDEYLKDETGNRRWLPVKTKTIADIEWLKENRDQMFAEAYQRVIVDKEEYWHFPKDELADIHREKSVEDPMAENVSRWYLNELSEEQRLRGVRTQEAFVAAFGDVGGRKPKNYESQMIGKSFRYTLFLEPKQLTENKILVRKYFPTDQTPRGDQDGDGFGNDF